MKLKLQLIIESDSGEAEMVREVTKLERYALRPETLGLTLSEAVLVQFPINGCSFWQNDFLGSMPPRSPPRALERSLLFWSAV